MADYIDRKQSTQKLSDIVDGDLILSALRNLYYELCGIPTANVKEVVIAENLNTDYHEVDQFICSECQLQLRGWTRTMYDEDGEYDWQQEYVLKYCPECGAKIKEQT